MKTRMHKFLVLFTIIFLTLSINQALYSQGGTIVYSITSGATTWSLRSYAANNYGVCLQLGTTWYEQTRPCAVEVVNTDGTAIWYTAPYTNISNLGSGRYQAIGTVTSGNGSVFTFTDIYSLNSAVEWTFQVSRTVKITVARPGDTGFSTRMVLSQTVNNAMTNFDFFAPGIWYKNNADVANDALATDYSDNYYWFREDRMPLPIFMLRQKSNNVTFSIGHLNPDGGTFTGEDGLNRIIDSRIKFASIGMQNNTRPEVGMLFPGTEGERTGVYGNSTSRRWALRANPVTLNFIQSYTMGMRLSYELTFTDAMKNTWNAYYRLFNPSLYPCNLPLIYSDQIAMLNDYWASINGVAGFPFYMQLSGAGALYTYDLGFVGNVIANASLLIREGIRTNNLTLITRGEQVAEWWANNCLMPSGCPRNWYDPAPATWRTYETYSRVIGDGMDGLLWAWNFEKKRGVNKVNWLNTCIRAANWLISQQGSDGSFPRAWNWQTSMVFNSSKTNTSHLIPFLVDMYKVTGNISYYNAALSAGGYIYLNDYTNFKYIGGTPDNPNVPDKEAASMALRAFLALYDLNKDNKWLDAATQTSYYYETWVYCWKVPIPPDDITATYPKNRSTTGLSLISTGNNSADSYASVDAFNFYRMYLYKGDAHLLQMSKFLLQNTKQGLNWNRNDPIPGFGRYGIIEEAQSVMIPRGHGVGLHLPWQTFNMMEPMVLLWDAFGINSYDISTVDLLANKHILHSNYSNTRGFATSSSLKSGSILNSTEEISDEPINIKIEIYPNPASSYINISSETSSNIELISILNANNVKVLDLEGSYIRPINITKLSPGLHILRIKMNGQYVNKIFIKE